MQTSTKTGIIAGIIGGLVGICVSELLYWTDKTLLFKGMGIISFLLVTLLMVCLSFFVFKKNTPIRELIKTLFVSYILFMAVLLSFQFVQYTYLSPDMPEQYRTWQMERETELMQQAGELTETIEARIAEWEQIDMRLTIPGTLQRFVFFLIPGFFIAAFIGLFFKAFTGRGF